MDYIPIDEDKAKELYDEALDEQGEVKVGTLTFYPSQILKECDPIAYRVGFSDWLDANEMTID
jgi:hypothetical protein